MVNDALGLGALSGGASKAIIKLLDVIQVGLGGAFAPWQKVRLAKAGAKAMVIGAKAELEIQQLRAAGQFELQRLVQREALLLTESKSGGHDGSPALATVGGAGPENFSLETRVHSRFEYQEAKRQLNIEQIALLAGQELGEAEVSDEPVDADWVARFFDSAKDVSNADMQQFWAKLLAGEVSKPGQFSLRTLDRLRNLTSAEAKLFTQCSSICTLSGGIIIPHDYEDSDLVKRTLPVSLADLQRLVEAGLLHAGQEVIWGGFDKEFSTSLSYTHVELRLVTRADSKFWGAWVHGLTTSGTELINLHEPSTSREFATAILESAKLHGFDVFESARDITGEAR